MALIPRQFFNAIVALGIAGTSGVTNYAATGFLYGQPVDGGANQEKVSRVFLITNRHVFEQQEKATLRFNMLADEPAKEYTLSLRDQFGRPAWFAHPDPKIDIAVACPRITKLKVEGIRFSYFREDSDASGIDACRAESVSEGDGVFVLGFPMGDVGVEQNFVIVRHGTIARIRDALVGKSAEFVLDSFIFSGNSGGPVVTRPGVATAEILGVPIGCQLIGVVKVVGRGGLGVKARHPDLKHPFFESYGGPGHLHKLGKLVRKNAGY
jgi:S1-C subfamily serine protease